MLHEEPKKNYTSIKDWAEDDRPREKLMAKGKSTLSDAELIAILIGSGTASKSAVEVSKEILQLADNNLHELAKFSYKDLQKIKGIGEAKAITIVSALELGRRRKESDILKRKKISSAQDVYEYMQSDLLDLNYEEFWIILLNRANNILKKVKISAGGVSGTVADPKVIFKKAIEETASAMILVHNHPSGNLMASQADKTLTNKIIEGGKFLDIQVLDHVIFTNYGYFSFTDEGLI